MPELPEVEAVCRSLKRLAGKTIRSVQVFRPRTVAPLNVREFSHRLRGARIVRVKRRGKFLVFQFEPNPQLGGHTILLVHLRMTGHLFVDSARAKLLFGPSVILKVTLEDSIILEDPRGLAVCRLLTESDAASRLSRLGPEPLSPQFTPSKLFEITRQSRSPIKTLLMEQRHLAGLGNIYAAEALFRAGIHPELPAASLSRFRARRLHQAIVGVLKDAVQSALRGYRRSGGFGPEESFEPQVYGREGRPCYHCGGLIRRCITRSRSTFYCPQCQRR